MELPLCISLCRHFIDLICDNLCNIIINAHKNGRVFPQCILGKENDWSKLIWKGHQATKIFSPSKDTSRGEQKIFAYYKCVQLVEISICTCLLHFTGASKSKTVAVSAEPSLKILMCAQRHIHFWTIYPWETVPNSQL